MSNNDELKREPALVFLHVPHTSGRFIRGKLNYLEKMDIVTSLHREDFMKKYTDKWDKYSHPIYIILREPVARTIGEFVHYSDHIKKFGWVNHITREMVKLNRSKYLDPFRYVNIENNRNLYCKFLLFRSDFSIPVTEEDYKELLDILENNLVLFDLFGCGYETLEYIVGHEIKSELAETKGKKGKKGKKTVYEVNDGKKSSLLSNKELISLISTMNDYDIKLYNLMVDKEDRDTLFNTSRKCHGIQ